MGPKSSPKNITAANTAQHIIFEIHYLDETSQVSSIITPLPVGNGVRQYAIVTFQWRTKKELSLKPALHGSYQPVTTSLHVPATINVRADVSFITLNSVHTITNASPAEKNISKTVIMVCCQVMKYVEFLRDRGCSTRHATRNTVKDITAVTQAINNSTYKPKNLCDILVVKYAFRLKIQVM